MGDDAAKQKLYHQIAIAFVVLTIIAWLCTLALLSGVVTAPGSFAPSTDVPLPLPHTQPPPGAPIATPGQ